MKTVILAGGLGTRLSEETELIPKPMIEIGGRPLLWHLMKSFSSQGFNEFSVALGYKGEVIKRYFLHYSQLESNLHIDLGSGAGEADGCCGDDWKVHLMETGRQTMTGGRLRRLRDQLDGTFFFTYGDGLSSVDLKALLQFHRSHGKLATVTAVSPPSRFGLLRMDKDRQVTSFSEKPGDTDDLINGGFFVLEPEAIDYIDGDTTSWEREPCEALVRDGQMLAYHHAGFWQCVDTLHELRGLRDLWQKGEARWKTW
jgi:glucose-1-phosphate cytidylyltransferase